MHSIGPIRRHPWRWIIVAVIALIAIALIAALLFVRSLLQPQRFTALLQSRLANVGLTLSVDKPAEPALWPHPAVQLRGFQLTSIGAGAPLLTATEARIVVPWRALVRRKLAIERLEIQSPRIDLDQLQTLLSRVPQTTGAPQLPRVGTGVRVTDGTLVRGDQPLLFDLDAETGPLLADVPFHLAATAHDGADQAGRLVFATLPRASDSGLRFDQIVLNARIEHGPQTQLGGSAVWNGGSDIAAALQGKLSVPATLTPAGSSSSAAAHAQPATSPMAREYTLAVQIVPARGETPLIAALKLDGANEHVDVRIPPLAVMDWWRGVLAAPDKPLALPPLQGHVQADEISYGPLRMQGVRVDAGPGVAPLSAGSTPEPHNAAANQQVAH